MGGLPTHWPRFAVSRWPTVGLPEIEGSVVLRGGPLCCGDAPVGAISVSPSAASTEMDARPTRVTPRRGFDWLRMSPSRRCFGVRSSRRVTACKWAQTPVRGIRTEALRLAALGAIQQTRRGSCQCRALLSERPERLACRVHVAQAQRGWSRLLSAFGCSGETPSTQRVRGKGGMDAVCRVNRQRGPRRYPSTAEAPPGRHHLGEGALGGPYACLTHNVNRARPSVNGRMFDDKQGGRRLPPPRGNRHLRDCRYLEP